MFKWFGFLVLVVAGILGVAFYHSTASINKLFTENHRLSKAIHNLTQEQQIGYAVLESQTRDQSGNIVNTVRFVQTAPDNPKVVVSEELYTLSSEIVYFDALVVKFTDDFVKDGKERSLYLWRRIYGEQTSPVEGQSIENPSSFPERYDSITRSLSFKNKSLFWDTVWELANDTQRLSDYGITAVYGNAVYVRPRPGKVYLFKISPTGQIYPETVNNY